MMHQQPALPTSNALHSERSQYRSLSLLLVVAMMAALLSVIYVAAIAPVLPALTQVASLSVPSSYVSSPLLSKPELVHLRSSYASHFDLGNGKLCWPKGISVTADSAPDRQFGQHIIPPSCWATNNFALQRLLGY